MSILFFAGLLFGVCGSMLWSQTDTLVVKSQNIVCQTCRRTLIRGLSTQRGIRWVEVYVPAKEIVVVYRTDKTAPEQIRQAIARLGYDADTVRRDTRAFERLPACCRAEEPH
ncbi:MAG: heavy-metal-associated domain-containing protein [Bacteroidia bacterium]|nr:heavy-metal-associated domain-containing protein [Bacteroidia bacterium]